MRSALPKNPTFFLLCCSSPSGFCPKISYDIPRHPTAPPSCLKHSWRTKQYIKPKQETFIFISTFFFSFFPSKPWKIKKPQAGMKENRESPNIFRAVAAEHWSTNSDFSSRRRQQNSCSMEREEMQTQIHKISLGRNYFHWLKNRLHQKTPRLFLEGFSVQKSKIPHRERIEKKNYLKPKCSICICFYPAETVLPKNIK